MRKHYIDFLRVFTVLLLVPYHTARIYDFFPFYIKEESNIWLHLFSYFMHQWRMPVLFLVSGVGTYFLLRSRKKSAFVKDRLTRLLIPFVFAVMVIVPPQGYYAMLDKGISIYHSFLEYYPHFFTFTLSSIDGFTGTFTPGHMWFILYLVLFSLISILIFNKISAQKDFFTNHSIWKLFLLLIPLYLANLLMRGMEMNPLFYLVLFLYGFLIVKEEKLEQTIEQNRQILFVIGLCTMSAVLLLEAFLVTTEGIGSVLFELIILLHSINTFMWVFAIIGYAKKYANFESKRISNWNKQVFTIYILHQTIIIFIGYYVTRVQIPLFIEYISIMVLTYILISLIIVALINKSRTLKLLFGSK